MNLPAPLPLLVLGGAIGLLLALIAARRSYRSAMLTAGFGLGGSLVSMLVPAPAAANALFDFGPLAGGLDALILVSAGLTLLTAGAYWRESTPVPREEFPLLILIATLGAGALADAANFITLFMGLETMTLAMIGLIAYPRFRPAAEEAALKYLILSAMSSAFVLFGIGAIELASGSLKFSHLLAWTPPDAASQAALRAGLALLAIGAGFKLSIVPFHIWVPDVYEGAPAPSGGFAAVVVKIAVLAVIIRLVGAAGGRMPADFDALITAVACLSMLVGNLLALLQDNLKRVLGFSSIAHLGYLLVAILAAGAIGQSAVIFYLAAYALTMLAAFGTIAALSSGADERDTDRIGELRGLFWTQPGPAAVLTLSLLSLAGIPPSIGFIAKMYIFAAGIHGSLWILTAFMVASSVIGLFYYLNIILVMSMRPAAPGSAAAGAPVSGPMGRLAIAALAMPILAFGIAPQPLLALLSTVFR
jgi:NADH-quinone oxidoreductase subunit N